MEGTNAPPKYRDCNSNFSGNLTEEVPFEVAEGPDVEKRLGLIYE